MKHLALVLLAALFSSTATAAPPEYSGVVSRGTTPALFVFGDWDTDLFAVLGGDPVELCNGSEDVDFVAWQDMSMRNGFRYATMNLGKDIRTSVYRFSEVRPYGWICPAVLDGVLPLAEGKVNYRMQDNDFEGTENCESKENFNSFGNSFAGFVYPTSGGQMRLVGHRRGVWDCDTGRLVHYDVKLSLTK